MTVFEWSCLVKVRRKVKLGKLLYFLSLHFSVYWKEIWSGKLRCLNFWLVSPHDWLRANYCNKGKATMAPVWCLHLQRVSFHNKFIFIQNQIWKQIFLIETHIWHFVTVFWPFKFRRCYRRNILLLKLLHINVSCLCKSRTWRLFTRFPSLIMFRAPFVVYRAFNLRNHFNSQHNMFVSVVFVAGGERSSLNSHQRHATVPRREQSKCPREEILVG